MGTTILADYPGGGYRTRVSDIPSRTLAGAGGGGGYGADMGWLMDLARRRAQQRLALGDVEVDMARRANRRQIGRGRFWEPRDPTEGWRQRAEIAQYQAIAQPPPLRFINKPGVAEGGWTPDVLAMSGAQRQVYLPQESTFTGGPTPEEAGEYEAATRRGAQRGDEWGIARTLGLKSWTGMADSPGYMPQIQPYWQREEEERRARLARLA